MIILTLIFIIILCLFPVHVSESVASSLETCLKSVIPSLFPFVVCSDIIVKSLRETNSFFLLFLSKIFNISSVSLWAFIPGILCGYPVGGKIAIDLYNENLISENERDRLLVFANNAGPGFIIGMVGGMFFKDIKTGVFLYFCHILASITYGIVTGFLSKPLQVLRKRKITEIPVSCLITEGIKKGVESMINITGVICFFSAIISLVDLIPWLSSFKYKGIIFGCFEITNGINIICSTAISYKLKVTITGFLLSFSGISIFMQLKSFFEKINTAAYFKGKLLCGIISSIYCFILL